MAFRGKDAPYNKLNETLFSRRTAQLCAIHLLPYLQPAHRILDIGYGPGSITIGLAQHVPDGEVVGIDINADSIQAAMSMAAEKNVRNGSFREADPVTDLANLDSESFDVVHAHQVLFYLPEPLKIMQEMRRITRPGGIVTTRDCVKRIPIPALPGLVKNLEAFYRFSRDRGAEPDFGQRHHITAHESGFDWRDIEFSSWASEESKLGKEAFVEGVKDSSRQVFIEAGVATEEECDEHAQAWHEWVSFRKLDG